MRYMSQQPDNRQQGTTAPAVASQRTDQPAAAAQSGTLLATVLRYVAILWRYKWIIISITFLAAAGSLGYAIISLRLPPEQSPLPNWYEANAALLQRRFGATQSVTNTVMASLGIRGDTGAMDYGQIAIEVLNSRAFIDRVVESNDLIERFGITSQVRTRSRRAVLQSVRSAFDPRTGILRISYRSTSPEFAAAMVASIVDELLRWFASVGGSDRLLAVETLEEKLAEVEGRIREVEGEIERFQRRYGVLRVEEIAQTQTDLLSGFQAQLLALDLQISNRQEVSRIENDPELLSLRSQRQSVLNLMHRIRSGYVGTDQLLPARDQLPALAADFSRLQMDLDIQRRIYQALNEQYEVARLTADTDPAFAILVPVEVPEEKSGPMRGQLVVTYTMQAFVASVVLALIVHWLTSFFRDPDKRRMFTEAFKR